ncbi:MAG TPA: VOC family protein [Haliangiales bacterium]|nr:VOC family protein [Haliangiales bacterium]
MSPLRPIPEGLPTITPHLVVSDAARAIELYAAALGAHEISRIVGPDGRRVVFAELILGDSRFFVVDEFPEQRAFSPTTLGGTPVALHVYFADVDAAYARAVAAGMRVEIPLADFFWGERYGSLIDPFGHHWGLASRIEDLSPADVQARARDFYGRDRS